jgi:hypothetical protein
MSTTEYHSVKVDAKPPGKLEVSGWPASREISATSHTLTVSATDEEPYPGKHSSGVKSVTVSLDGGPASTVTGASCSPGTCTASGTYALNAEDLTEGVHRLVVVAADNANNVSPAKEFTFDVRHGSSVSVGPGTVDPTTGQLKLSAIEIIAWNKDGSPIAPTTVSAPALTFGVPSRSWSRGQRAPRGVCSISLDGLDEASSLQGGAVMTAVRPRRDVRGREFVNCARSEYLLAGKRFAEADVLLDAAHPGATPAPLPGIRPLPGHSGIFLGEGAGGKELACRIPDAWLLVTQGKDLAQHLALLEHLRATVWSGVHSITTSRL